MRPFREPIDHVGPTRELGRRVRMQEPLTRTEELSAVILAMLRQDCAQKSDRTSSIVGPPAPRNARSSHLPNAGMWNWAPKGKQLSQIVGKIYVVLVIVRYCLGLPRRIVPTNTGDHQCRNKFFSPFLCLPWARASPPLRLGRRRRRQKFSCHGKSQLASRFLRVAPYPIIRSRITPSTSIPSMAAPAATALPLIRGTR